MTFTLVEPPLEHPVMGNLRVAAADPYTYYGRMKQMGDFVKVRYLMNPIYHIAHPDLIQELLVKQARSFNKSRITKMVFGRLIDDNIFVADWDYWKEQRKLMQPAFHSQRIGAYADDMVRITEETIADWQTGDEVIVDDVMADITMKIIVKTMFNTDLDDLLNEVGAATTEVLSIVAEGAFDSIPMPKWIPTSSNRRLKAGLQKLEQLYDRVLADWRMTGTDRGDLLSMLMLARYDDGQAMTDEQLKAEIGTIFVAGHETTATTLTFAWLLLAKHPEIADKLHQELDQVLGGRAATLDDLKHLTYTERIIKETMRLYPAASFLARGAAEDVELGGYSIKKGSTVSLSLYHLHRDERWYDDPLTFNPDRWTPEFDSARPRYAYLPFGGGPRVCLGNQFAMLEAQLVLATIAQKYHLQLKQDRQIVPKFGITLKLEGGKLQMRVTERT